MSRLAADPNRKLFIQKEKLPLWECWDYKTFYMTVRKQNTELDKRHRRDEDKYILYMSSSETFDNIDTPENAMKMGYERANKLYNRRLKSKPNMV